MINCKSQKRLSNQRHHRDGVALVFALIALAVLTSLSYALVTKITAHKHRLDYFIDHQKARYGCASGLRYGMARMKDVEIKYADRSGQPDFSDVFWMGDDEYQEYLSNWAEIIDEERQLEQEEKKKQKKQQKEELVSGLADMLMLFGLADPSALMSGGEEEGDDELPPVDPELLSVPGPYGPEWPLVVKADELDIGDVKVTVRIEDENAKLPVILALTRDPEIEREKKACFMSFFEWMGLDKSVAEDFFEDVDEIVEVKYFDLEMEDVAITEGSDPKKSSVSRPTSPQESKLDPEEEERRSRRFASRVQKTETKVRTQADHINDYARLMGAMLDTERLGSSVMESGDRPENALKYLGIRGSRKVNVNTAPRNVLEAVFAFGGDADMVAEQIIVERQEKPFEDLDDIKSRLLGYSDSVKKVEQMITTESIFFTINIEARVGNAVVRSVTSVLKIDDKVQSLSTFAE